MGKILNYSIVRDPETGAITGVIIRELTDDGTPDVRHSDAPADIAAGLKYEKAHPLE